MDVRFTVDTPMAEVTAFLEKEVADRRDLVLQSLKRVAEGAIAEARLKSQPKGMKGDFKDQTGNLRASYGYLILEDGKPVQKAIAGDSHKYGSTGGDEGAERANSLLDLIQADYPKGIVLIVLAGMKYGVYVQARGYDVLLSAENKVQLELKNLANILHNAHR